MLRRVKVYVDCDEAIKTSEIEKSLADAASKFGDVRRTASQDIKNTRKKTEKVAKETKKDVKDVGKKVADKVALPSVGMPDED